VPIKVLHELLRDEEHAHSLVITKGVSTKHDQLGRACLLRVGGLSSSTLKWRLDAATWSARTGRRQAVAGGTARLHNLTREEKPTVQRYKA
jgi:hypothetical protein